MNPSVWVYMTCKAQQPRLNNMVVLLYYQIIIIYHLVYIHTNCRIHLFDKVNQKKNICFEKKSY